MILLLFSLLLLFFFFFPLDLSSTPLGPSFSELEDPHEFTSPTTTHSSSLLDSQTSPLDSEWTCLFDTPKKKRENTPTSPTPKQKSNDESNNHLNSMLAILGIPNPNPSQSSACIIKPTALREEKETVSPHSPTSTVHRLIKSTTFYLFCRN